MLYRLVSSILKFWILDLVLVCLGEACGSLILSYGHLIRLFLNDIFHSLLAVLKARTAQVPRSVTFTAVNALSVWVWPSMILDLFGQ